MGSAEQSPAQPVVTIWTSLSPRLRTSLPKAARTGIAPAARPQVPMCTSTRARKGVPSKPRPFRASSRRLRSSPAVSAGTSGRLALPVPLDDLRNVLDRELPVDLGADRDRGGEAAAADAADGLQREEPILRGLVDLDSERGAEALHEALGAAHVAGRAEAH